MYEATFFRPLATCLDWTIKMGDIRVDYRPDRQNGLAMFCKKLVDRGYNDGAIVLQEVGCKKGHGLRHTYPSIHAYSNKTDNLVSNNNPTVKKEVPMSDDTIVRRRGRKPNPNTVPTLFSINVDGTSMLVTIKQKEAFGIVSRGDTSAWNELHGKTKNHMVNAGWVANATDPSLTELGQKIAGVLGVHA